MSREQTNELVREQAMHIADIVTKANTRPPDPPLSDVGMACRLRDCAEVWEMTLWRLLDKVDRANDRSAEPVGSAPYVRRLRDQAAVAALGGLVTRPGTLFSEDAAGSIEAANELVRAAGYDPLGEGSEE